VTCTKYGEFKPVNGVQSLLLLIGSPTIKKTTSKGTLLDVEKKLLSFVVVHFDLK
jgi:hypothetical protein